MCTSVMCLFIIFLEKLFCTRLQLCIYIYVYTVLKVTLDIVKLFSKFLNSSSGYGSNNKKDRKDNSSAQSSDSAAQRDPEVVLGLSDIIIISHTWFGLGQYHLHHLQYYYYGRHGSCVKAHYTYICSCTNFSPCKLYTYHRSKNNTKYTADESRPGNKDSNAVTMVAKMNKPVLYWSMYSVVIWSLGCRCTNCSMHN